MILEERVQTLFFPLLLHPVVVAVIGLEGQTTLMAVLVAVQQNQELQVGLELLDRDMMEETVRVLLVAVAVALAVMAPLQ
jgi:hypothetical protein